MGIETFNVYKFKMCAKENGRFEELLKLVEYFLRFNKNIMHIISIIGRDAKKEDKYYFDKIIGKKKLIKMKEKYSRPPQSFNQKARFIFNNVSGISFSRDTNIKILDFGCGHCTLGASLAQLYNQNKSWGCDVEKWAEKEMTENKSNLEFSVIKEDEKLPYRSNFFDIVLVSHVFHHLKNKDFAMKELYRILSKGGYLYVVEHDAYLSDKYLIELHHLLYIYVKNKKIFSKSGGDLDYYSDYFSLGELRDILERHNFHYVKHKFQHKYSEEKFETKIHREYLMVLKK